MSSNVGIPVSSAARKDANSVRIMDFVTGTDKVEANVNDAVPEYTEVSAPGVTSVAEAINFANSNKLFLESTGDSNDYVFIAGATHGYLIVNVNGDTGDFDPGTDYVVVLQNLNDLTKFGAGDIISV